jgi:broad specificity phosphatase PhoE
VLAMLCSLLLAAATVQPVTTVILVRHAEKAAAAAMMTSDTPLSAAGQARAKELARALGSTHIDAIYTTQYLRTKQTAEPLAKEIGVTPVAIDAGASYASDLAQRIRLKNAGQTVLVVGHSNTTPDVIRALGIESPPAIADSEYDALFIVALAPDATPKLLTLRYGAPAR